MNARENAELFRPAGSSQEKFKLRYQEGPAQLGILAEPTPPGMDWSFATIYADYVMPALNPAGGDQLIVSHNAQSTAAGVTMAFPGDTDAPSQVLSVNGWGYADHERAAAPPSPWAASVYRGRERRDGEGGFRGEDRGGGGAADVT
jgi:hypothetical protein